MYDRFYSLTARPFQLTPDPAFYFESGTHRKALSYLGYGLAQGEGFIVITGEVGAGKSTLVAHLMDSIDPARMLAVKLVSTQVGGDDMLRLVAHQFGIETGGRAKAEVLSAIEGWLRDVARSGKRTLLLVDEAQCLDVSALEELRMLSNFQLGGQALLQIFLLGQPEFRDVLMSPMLEQLRQRVIATHHLEPMQADEIGPYVQHRLARAGWAGNPQFTPTAYAAMFDFSEGIPRKLNILASRVLLFGAMEQLQLIDDGHVMAVIRDMGGDVLDSADMPEEAVASVPAAADAEPVVEPSAAAEPAPGTPMVPDQHDGAEADVLDLVSPAPLEAATPEAASAPVAPARWIEAAPAAMTVPMAEPETAPSTAADAAHADEIAALKARIDTLEKRLETQDASLRRVLSMLIVWAENGAENGADHWAEQGANQPGGQALSQHAPSLSPSRAA